jgi:hypothetical protein
MAKEEQIISEFSGRKCIELFADDSICRRINWLKCVHVLKVPIGQPRREVSPTKLLHATRSHQKISKVVMLSTAGHVRRVTNRRLRLAGRERRGDENSIHLIRLISRLEEAKTSHFRESISSHGADGDLLQPMRHRRANERKPFFSI